MMKPVRTHVLLRKRVGADVPVLLVGHRCRLASGGKLGRAGNRSGWILIQPDLRLLHAGRVGSGVFGIEADDDEMKINGRAQSAVNESVRHNRDYRAAQRLAGIVGQNQESRLARQPRAQGVCDTVLALQGQIQRQRRPALRC
jgi:hypothetical protein